MGKVDSPDIFELGRSIDDVPDSPGTLLKMLCIGAGNLLTKDEMYGYDDFFVVLFSSLAWFLGVRSVPKDELEQGKMNYVMSFVHKLVGKYPMDELVSLVLINVELTFHKDLSLFHQMYGIPPEHLNDYFKTTPQKTDDLNPFNPIPILYDIPEIKS